MWRALNWFQPRRELVDALDALECLGADRRGPAASWLILVGRYVAGTSRRPSSSTLSRGARFERRPEAHFSAATIADDLTAVANRLEAVTTIAGTLRRYEQIPPEASPGVVSFGHTRGFPLAGDLDGDGRDDVAIYRDGTWQIRYASDGTTPSVAFRSGSWPQIVPVARADAGPSGRSGRLSRLL